jgi:hypothetical protein
VRHKVTVSAVYAPTPYKGDTTSFYNYLANGWSIAPIYQFYSGQPYSGTGPANLNGTSGSNIFPFNSRNSYRNPNLWNIDLRVSKRLKFTERYNLEFLAEGFNITNRSQVASVNFTQYGNPVTTTINGVTTGNCVTINGIPSTNPNGLCSQPSFGTPFSLDSNLFRERQIQFAVRFEF